MTKLPRRLLGSLSSAEGRPPTPKAETGTLKWEEVTELHWPLLVGMEPVAVAPPALPRRHLGSSGQGWLPSAEAESWPWGSSLLSFKRP